MDDLNPEQLAQIQAQLQEQLKDLKDIHLPDPVSVWPLAPGWWGLMILIPVLYFLIRFIVKRMLMPKYKKLALLELKNIESNYQASNNAHETCGEVSLLIRKALVAKLGNEAIAGLVTEEWLAYLDKLSRTDCFSNGVGRHIVTTVYSNPESDTDEINIEELFSATKKLLGRL